MTSMAGTLKRTSMQPRLLSDDLNIWIGTISAMELMVAYREK